MRISIYQSDTDTTIIFSTDQFWQSYGITVARIVLYHIENLRLVHSFWQGVAAIRIGCDVNSTLVITLNAKIIHGFIGLFPFFICLQIEDLLSQNTAVADIFWLASRKGFRTILGTDIAWANQRFLRIDLQLKANLLLFSAWYIWRIANHIGIEAIFQLLTLAITTIPVCIF